MVKVAGPMLSLDASGKLAGAVVYSKWKGRNYVRTLVTPANPKSAMQTGVRAMFKFLSQQWTTMLTADKATWDDRAAALVASNFNAYMSANMSRHRNGLAPSWADPAALTPGETGNINWTDVDGGIRMVTHSITRVAPQTNWGTLFARSLTDGFTPGLDTVVAVRSFRTGATHTWIDTPLAAGTYYYRIRHFNRFGVLHDTWVAQESAVVTDA